MIKRVKFDDSKTIFFNFEDTSIEELDNLELSYFDVFNIPKDYYKLKNYFITFYNCPKSSTGVVAMFVNRNRKIYDAKLGYTPETVLPISYEFNHK
jgi:hypothetical protein